MYTLAVMIAMMVRNMGKVMLVMTIKFMILMIMILVMIRI